MVKNLSVLLLLVFLTLNAACASSADGEQGSPASSASTLIADGEWEFRVDRGLSESSSIERVQSDTLTEDDFVLVSEGVTDRVTVSADGTEVLIRLGASDDQLAQASLSAVVDGVARYDVDEAPGGRFLVWLADGSVQAELALYGSGVPLAMCVRGVLVPSP